MAEQACYQSEGIKLFISYSHFKMEGLHLLKDLLRQNDFMCKVDLKRCLLLHSFAKESSKISSISMTGKHLRVLVSMFWSGSSTSDFYKTIKDSHCNFEVDSNLKIIIIWTTCC